MNGLINSIKNKAKAFGEKLSPSVQAIVDRPITTYDPSKHDILIAGKSMSAWTSATITTPQLASQIASIDPNSMAVVKKSGVTTLSINFLPTAEDAKTLTTMQAVCWKFSKYFFIEIIENGAWHSTYKAQFLKTPDITLDAEAQDLEFEFALLAVSERDRHMFKYDDPVAATDPFENTP